MQKAAEAAVVSSLPEIEARIARMTASNEGKEKNTDEPLQASLIALDPATGEVRAIVGGRDTAERRAESRAAVETPAGLGLQTVRLRGGDRERIFTRDASSIA